jgi:hypothetical protein
MRSSNKDIDKIEEALIAAHRRQEDYQFPPNWRGQVMQDVESLAKSSPVPQEKKIKTIIPKAIGALATLALAVVAVWFVLTIDWVDPWVSLQRDMTAPKSHAAFSLEAGDDQSGLRSLTVIVIQEEVRIKVYSKNFEPPGGALFPTSNVVKKVNIPLKINTQALGLHEGEATIEIKARDLSWNNGFKGRETIIKKNIIIYHKSR